MNPGHLSKSRKTDATSLNLYLFCSRVLWVYRQEQRTLIKGSASFSSEGICTSAFGGVPLGRLYLQMASMYRLKSKVSQGKVLTYLWSAW